MMVTFSSFPLGSKSNPRTVCILAMCVYFSIQNSRHECTRVVIHSSSVKPFLLIWVSVDPESILGILSMRWEYTLNGIPLLHTLSQADPHLGAIQMFLGGWKKLENLEEIHTDVGRTRRETPHKQELELSIRSGILHLATAPWCSFSHQGF